VVEYLQERFGARSMQRVFEMLDENRDGHVSGDEFGGILKCLGMDMEKEDERKMFQEFDESGDGQLQYHEFVDIVFGQDAEKEKRR
jgi:Ca2+-binding EF-hand superfamily protein